MRLAQSATQARLPGPPRFALLLGILLLAAVIVSAQSFTGSILGTVTDQTGAVLPNAQVIVKSVDTGIVRTTTTNTQGLYSFAALAPGQYRITVEAKNFAKSEKLAALSVSQQLRLDIGVSTQTVVEAVEVQGGAVAVQMQDAQLSNVVSDRQVTELPLLTRNAYDLVGLSAGAADGPDRGSGFQRGAGFAINGQRSQSANFMLDGGENNDTFSSLTGQNVPVDSIQEFRVQTSNYTAEFGRGAGFVANVVTKSGTNRFHGTAYEFNRNSKLAANDSFNNANGTPKPFFNRNQFGFSLGGPVIKDKTFFFSNWEWLKIRSSTPIGFYVPTSQLIAATSPATKSIFAKYAAPTPTGTLLTAADLELDPLTGANGVALPANMPLFGRVETSLPQDAGAGTPQDTVSGVARIDHHFSDKTTLMGRYAYERTNGLPGTNSYSPYAGFTTAYENRNQNLTLTLTHVWTNNLVTESRFVYNRLLNNQPLGESPDVPTFSITDIIAARSNGDIVLPGYFATASNLGAAIPFGGPQNLYQGYHSLAWQKGKHSLKFGFQYIHMRDNRVFGAYQEAIADFQSVQNFIDGNVADYELAVDPKGKLPGQVLNAPFGPPSFGRHYHYNELASFANDTWKVTNRLTLNLGVRWEYFGVMHSPDPEKQLDANFYLGSGSNFLQQVANGQFGRTIDQTGDLKDRFYKPEFKNFAPRIGFAYDLSGNGKMVLRGGYGMFYDRNFGNVLFNAIQNPPNYAVVFAGESNDQPRITANLNQYAALAPVSGVSYSSSARALKQDMKTAYANVWNVNIQREVGNLGLFEIAYAGSNGIHLYSLNNINRSSSGVLLGKSGRLNSKISSINYRGNDGHSNYHSLQMRADSRQIKSLGLQFTAAYTWAHAIDNSSSTFGDSYLLSRVGNGVFGSQDAFNPSGDKGSADFDVRHRFVTSFNWDIPFAKNLQHKFAKAILDGWAMSGVLSFRTGYPFTIYDSQSAGNSSSQQTTRATLLPGKSMPKVGQLTPVPGEPGAYTYINFNGILGPGPSVNGPFPSNVTGRNAFRAPGMQTWNMSFMRNIQLNERFKLQFRSEFFNIFNHANLFVNGGSNDIKGVNNKTGKLGNSQVVVTRGGTITMINNAEQHRNVQLALKLIF